MADRRSRLGVEMFCARPDVHCESTPANSARRRPPSSPGAWRSDSRRRVPAGREYDRAIDFVRVIGNVATHSSRVELADACFRDCIGAAWQLLTAAPMLRSRRAMCVRHRLLPVIPAKVGKHWIARPRLMLCL